MRSEIMLFVHDVAATSRWYQDFLGLESAHGGSEFEMLVSAGQLVLQLHHIEPDDHDHGVRLDATLGAGVVLFLHVDDPAALFERAKALGLDVVEALHYNELAHMHAFTVRDPNGYTISLCRSERG